LSDLALSELAAADGSDDVDSSALEVDDLLLLSAGTSADAAAAKDARLQAEIAKLRKRVRELQFLLHLAGNHSSTTGAANAAADAAATSSETSASGGGAGGDSRAGGSGGFAGNDDVLIHRSRRATMPHRGAPPRSSVATVQITAPGTPAPEPAASSKEPGSGGRLRSSTGAAAAAAAAAAAGASEPIDMRQLSKSRRSPRTKKRFERQKNAWKHKRPEKRNMLPSTSPVPDSLLGSSLSPTSGADLLHHQATTRSDEVQFDDDSLDEHGSAVSLGGGDSLRTTSEVYASGDTLPRSSADSQLPPISSSVDDEIIRLSVSGTTMTTSSTASVSRARGGKPASQQELTRRHRNATAAGDTAMRLRMHQSMDPSPASSARFLSRASRDDAERHDASTPLHRLCMRRQCDVAELRELLDNGADVNSEDGQRCVPLVCALRARNYDAADCLLDDERVRVDVTDERGSSLIHVALLYSDNTDDGQARVHDVCARILDLGDAVELVSTPNNVGYTPLYSAFHNANLSVARLLLSRGADINQRSTSGLAPLHYVARRDMLPALELCFKYKCDVSLRDMQNGDTALHIAARSSLAHTCERLLQKDADPSMTNYEGKIALDLATDKQTIKVLEDYDPRQKSWKWMIDFRDLSFVAGGGGVLGRGNFSVVRLGRLHGTPVAVKFLKVGSVTAAQLSAFQQEIGLMSDIRHPNVLCFLGGALSYSDDVVSPERSPRRSSSSSSLRGSSLLLQSGSLRWSTPGVGDVTRTIPRQLCIITELAEQSLRDHLTSLTRFDAAHFLTLAVTTARGMAWLHSRSPPVLHRDLHTRNVLLDKGHQCKVCDFGLSSIQVLASVTAPAPGDSPSPTVSPAPSTSRSSSARPLMYRRIIAPELRQSESAVYTVKADVFAYGLVLCELMFPHMDWPNLRAERKIEVNGMRTTPTLRDVEALVDADALDPVRGIHKPFHRSASSPAGFFASVSPAHDAHRTSPPAAPSPAPHVRGFTETEKRLRLMVLRLLIRCCARDPADRPTFVEILSEFDPFLLELDATFRRLVGVRDGDVGAGDGAPEDVDEGYEVCDSAVGDAYEYD
jgi:serine/threonine protein kinase/ankyrin repeat protein